MKTYEIEICAKITKTITVEAREITRKEYA